MAQVEWRYDGNCFQKYQSSLNQLMLYVAEEQAVRPLTSDKGNASHLPLVLEGSSKEEQLKAMRRNLEALRFKNGWASSVWNWGNEQELKTLEENISAMQSDTASFLLPSNLHDDISNQLYHLQQGRRQFTSFLEAPQRTAEAGWFAVTNPGEVKEAVADMVAERIRLRHGEGYQPDVLDAYGAFFGQGIDVTNENVFEPVKYPFKNAGRVIDRNIRTCFDKGSQAERTWGYVTGVGDFFDKTISAEGFLIGGTIYLTGGAALGSLSPATATKVAAGLNFASRVGGAAGTGYSLHKFTTAKTEEEAREAGQIGAASLMMLAATRNCGNGQNFNPQNFSVDTSAMSRNPFGGGTAMQRVAVMQTPTGQQILVHIPTAEQTAVLMDRLTATFGSIEAAKTALTGAGLAITPKQAGTDGANATPAKEPDKKPKESQNTEEPQKTENPKSSEKPDVSKMSDEDFEKYIKRLSDDELLELDNLGKSKNDILLKEMNTRNTPVSPQQTGTDSTTSEAAEVTTSEATGSTTQATPKKLTRAEKKALKLANQNSAPAPAPAPAVQPIKMDAESPVRARVIDEYHSKLAVMKARNGQKLYHSTIGSPAYQRPTEVVLHEDISKGFTNPKWAANTDISPELGQEFMTHIKKFSPDGNLPGWKPINVTDDFLGKYKIAAYELKIPNRAERLFGIYNQGRIEVIGYSPIGLHEDLLNGATQWPIQPMGPALSWKGF